MVALLIVALVSTVVGEWIWEQRRSAFWEAERRREERRAHSRLLRELSRHDD